MNKYNTQQTGNYSQKLAKVLSDKFFQGKSTINGQELMSFSPIKQVNLLLVKELLGTWHREMASLKSPYFDYEAEPVKNSLAEFMNVLSQHILINRANFEPLAQRAINNTMLLATDMPAFFEQVFLQDDKEVDLDKLKSYLRYLAYGRELFTGFINDLHLGNINRDFVLQRFKLYLNAHYKEQADMGKLLAELNQALPLPEAGQEDKTAPAAQPEAVKVAEPAPKMPPAASDPAPIATQAPTPKPPQATMPPAAPPQPVAPAIQAAPQPAAVPPQAPAPAPERPKAPVSEATASGGINDRYRVEHQSLNDKMRKPVAATLADTIGERKIESLKNSISINQRFAFINELFGGDNQAYHAAINQLDQQPDLAQARDFVLNDLTNAFAWNPQGEHVAKLLRLIERKFA